MRRVPRQTFFISDTLSAIRKISDNFEMDLYSPQEAKIMIDKATKMGLVLMMGYPREHFLPEESEFLSDFMNRLNYYSTQYGDYTDEF